MALHITVRNYRYLDTEPMFGGIFGLFIKGLVAGCHFFCFFFKFFFMIYVHTFIQSHSFSTFNRRHSPRSFSIIYCTIFMSLITELL
jgi:hypothetical protein